MKAQRVQKAGKLNPDNLLFNLAEQLKLPFVAILHAAQSMEGSVDLGRIEASRSDIALSAQAALRLIDGYFLSVELQRASRLELEPVSISSLLYETAHTLEGYAQAHDCELQLDVAGKYGPVMAHKRAIASALTSLGQSFIESAAQSEERRVVKLSVRRVQNGIATGVFSNNSELSSALLKQARALSGKARQPLPGFDSGSGAGVFIADALFGGMNTTMRVAHSGGNTGLAATLLPSRQLNLI